MAGALAIGFSTHGIGVFDVKGDAGGPPQLLTPCHGIESLDLLLLFIKSVAL